MCAPYIGKKRLFSDRISLILFYFKFISIIYPRTHTHRERFFIDIWVNFYTLYDFVEFHFPFWGGKTTMMMGWNIISTLSLCETFLFWCWKGKIRFFSFLPFGTVFFLRLSNWGEKRINSVVKKQFDLVFVLRLASKN